MNFCKYEKGFSPVQINIGLGYFQLSKEAFVYGGEAR